MPHASVVRTLAAVLLTSAALTAAAQQPESSEKSPAREPRPVVAVIGWTPADDVDPRDAWMAEAIEEALTWRLRRIPEVVAIPPIRCSQAQRDLRQPGGATPDWPQVLPHLGAKVLIRGRFGGPPDAVRLDGEFVPLQPAEAPSRLQIGPAPFFEALDGLTRGVLDRLKIASISSASEAVVLAPPSSSLSAVEYFARASRAARRDEVDNALRYLRDAVSYDSTYRPAQLLLGQLELRLPQGAAAVGAARLRQLQVFARDANDRIDLSEIDAGLSLIHAATGQPEIAAQRLDRAYELARGSGDPYACMSVLSIRVDFHLSRSRARKLDAAGSASAPAVDPEQLALAARCQEELVALLNRVGDRIACAPACNKLGLIYEEQGEMARAYDAHRQTLAAAEEAGSADAQATAWLFIGQWHRRQKQMKEALDALQRCRALVPAENSAPVELALADVYDDPAVDQPREALKSLDSAYSQLKSGADLTAQLSCVRRIAGLKWKLGDRAAARASLQEAIDLAHVLELPAKAELQAQLDAWNREKP